MRIASVRGTHFAVPDIDVAVEAQAEAPSPHVALHCGRGTPHDIAEQGARALKVHCLTLLDFGGENETVERSLWWGNAYSQWAVQYHCQLDGSDATF